jgi:molecular chaperone GrpE
VAASTKEHDYSLLPPADLAGAIERLQEDLDKERDRSLRTLADFANYRRRMESDGNKLAREGKREIVLRLLDIMDDMEKALQWSGTGARSMTEGIRLIHDKLQAILEAQGVVPFGSVGTPFNPDRHDAVAMAPMKGSRPGTVVDELRRGYLWRDELLRAAQVRVAG